MKQETGNLRGEPNEDGTFDVKAPSGRWWGENYISGEAYLRFKSLGHKSSGLWTSGPENGHWMKCKNPGCEFRCFKSMADGSIQFYPSAEHMCPTRLEDVELRYDPRSLLCD